MEPKRATAMIMIAVKKDRWQRRPRERARSRTFIL
jgi:hypothetical protein